MSGLSCRQGTAEEKEIGLCFGFVHFLFFRFGHFFGHTLFALRLRRPFL